MKRASAVLAGLVMLATFSVAPAPVSATELLGRLFLSPGERAALDRARHAAEAAPPVPVAAVDPALVVPEAPVAVQPSMAVDGVVARSAGTPTVWVNGIEAGTGDLDPLGIAPGSIRVEGARVSLPLASGGGVTLKPGQRFDPATDSVSDAYEQDAAP